jgi:hypothetical protein
MTQVGTYRQGQAMILTTIAMGGSLIVITTIAGLVTLYQLRQLSSVTSSAKAIYAAEAGLEWGIYQYQQFKRYEGLPTSFDPSGKELPTPFSNGAVAITRCLDENGVIINTTLLSGPPYTPCDANLTAVVRAIGRDRGVSRAMQLSLQGAFAAP